MCLDVDDRWPWLNEQTIQQPLPLLRWLKYTSARASDYHIDQKFLAGACQALTYLNLNGVCFASEQGTPTFPALRELKIRSATVNHNLEPLFAIIASAPLLESLFLNVYIETEAINSICTRAKVPIHLPALHKVQVQSDIPFAFFFLKRVPDPTHTFVVDLAYHYYDVDAHLPNDNNSHMYNEVYDRVLTFWKRRTCEQYLPLRHFIYSHPNTFAVNRMPRVQFGATHMDVCFNAKANINVQHSFWSHVETLHLRKPTSTEVLLSENLHFLRQISALIIEIKNPEARDIQVVREWLLSRASSEGFVIRKITFLRCFDDWKDLADEIQAMCQNIQVDQTDIQYPWYP
jgi:hypothetical protein